MDERAVSRLGATDATTLGAAMSLNVPGDLNLESSTSFARPLVLKFGGSLVEQLGAQLYPSVTATVAELISNAWDADALNVWVTVPFGQEWRPSAEIIVLDDGHGMTRSEAQEAYLVVGRKKRLTSLGDKSEGGRLVHGRKGIGKLAAFGTAGYLECVTLRDGALTAFGLDYDELRHLNPDQDYYVDKVEDVRALEAPGGAPLAHGTRVRLTKLRVKRRISAETFQVSMSRRFALRDMNVWINGELLRRFEIPLQFRLPRDEAPPGVSVDADGWGTEILPSGDRVRWWIGFTEKPLVDGDQQGISVLARDKMAQRPFKFEMSQGTTSQLGFEYLVGEVEANWLDQGDDIETDYIQSNRDQLQLEDARLDEFMEWGRRRLTWALRVRGELRAKLVAAEAESNDELQGIIKGSSAREKRALLGVATKLAGLPEIRQGDLNDIMRTVVQSRSDAQVRELMEEIDDDTEPAEARMWALVTQFGAIDAGRLLSVLEARISTIEKLQGAIHADMEIPDLVRIVRQDIWLLNPRWHLLGEEIDLSETSHADDGGSHRFDGMFALKPKSPARMDELVLIQLVHGVHAGETVNTATARDVEMFSARLSAVEGHYGSQAPRPLVEGMLVAQKFSDDANAVRSNLDAVSGGRLRMVTWREALDGSLRMHQGWLNVSRERATLA